MPYPYSEDDARWWVETGCKQDGLNRAIALDDECIGMDEHVFVRFRS
jgi:hypothetical protein